ncbi:ABC-type transport system involved in multi-copper enzyme maturation, permease component [Sphingobacterium mizutaii]|uniref:ABC-type transport system involved in multi-copper enzyme maturation, permease component n=2 Tax=Sphingobacterium mizutaii TaxID=1010 RepID=A0AAJ4XBZ5_9SPHI|nr:ABC transporter permease [Sphingobacterium mizutaii]SDL05745.1 ABC-2 type transport system permease protein [Sphingobacterium mizutaii]SNV50833.1 ABC-type transport system involved in multi-copper enzyme maturation, permease component [Sphingobacterium mizutaii]
MNKILLIIQREYLSRVKKKSFLLTTFLVPLFFIGMYVGVFFLTKKSFEDSKALIYVVDNSKEVGVLLKNTEQITFTQSTQELNQQIQEIKDLDGNTNILMIPEDFYQSHHIEFLSSGKPNIGTKAAVESQLEDILLEYQYKELNIDASKIKSIDTKINTAAKEITSSGEAKDSDTRIAMGIAMALSVLIYLSLFLYGAQVMRGIIEEKSNRIIEVIISSVKPFQLMMGKIIGIGLVGITQFVLWIILSFGLISIASNTLIDKSDFQKEMMQNAPQGAEMQMDNNSIITEISTAMDAVNIPELLITFFLFFIGGYMLYSALFAAVGSAVDNETEANQFTMPITTPLLLAYILSFGVLVNNPHGPIATWLSFIPLTSPIAMLVRIPFGVPTWQIIVSFILLVAGFIFTTWVAARIYRIGILMYGKKASFKELIKWFRYKS